MVSLEASDLSVERNDIPESGRHMVLTGKICVIYIIQNGLLEKESVLSLNSMELLESKEVSSALRGNM